MFDSFRQRPNRQGLQGHDRVTILVRFEVLATDFDGDEFLIRQCGREVAVPHRAPGSHLGVQFILTLSK